MPDITPAADSSQADSAREEIPSTFEEWMTRHIVKLESAVDDFLFALKAGAYGSVWTDAHVCTCGDARSTSDSDQPGRTTP